MNGDKPLPAAKPLTDAAILARTRELVVAYNLMSRREAELWVSEGACPRIASDGSTRRFWRVARDGRPCCLIVAPAGTSDAELAEARSAWLIGKHLYGKGIPVPKLYGWDGPSGILLVEDLGDTRLHDRLLRAGTGRTDAGDEVLELYRRSVAKLAAMQWFGREGFDQDWCWDTGRYDVQLMVDRESGYFLRACWQGLLGQDIEPEVAAEMAEIARRAGEAPADFFLHRDFQSRNIMIKEGAVRFIDFQGGRLGPLGYDLASLLIDPYSGLDEEVQQQLVARYLADVRRYLAVDGGEFSRYYALLAFQRNVQIVGAFSFLFKVRGKLFFRRFIGPSLQMLQARLRDPLFKEFVQVRQLVDQAVQALPAD